MATTKKPYEPNLESEAVQQAQANLQAQLDKKPGAYESSWQTQLQDTMDKILSRQPFQYDVNGDALYQQYKDQYTSQGRLAMMDTMGQAASLTGGYGNSYAQRAGQQAYQGYLQGLNDKIPELYSLALSRYQTEGDEMARNLGLMQQQENQDYSRYQDSMNAWLTERDYLQGVYDSERNLAASIDAETWNRAMALYNMGINTPEIRSILGVPAPAPVAAPAVTYNYTPTGPQPTDPTFKDILEAGMALVDDNPSTSEHVTELVNSSVAAGYITEKEAATIKREVHDYRYDNGRPGYVNPLTKYK